MARLIGCFVARFLAGCCGIREAQTEWSSRRTTFSSRMGISCPPRRLTPLRTSTCSTLVSQCGEREKIKWWIQRSINLCHLWVRWLFFGDVGDGGGCGSGGGRVHRKRRILTGELEAEYENGNEEELLEQLDSIKRHLIRSVGRRSRDNDASLIFSCSSIRASGASHPDQARGERLSMRQFP